MASAGLNLDWNDSPDISNSQFDPVTVCALGDILSENIIHDMGALDQENGITALVMRVIHSLIFLVNLLAARLNRSVQDTFASEQVAKATATAEALAKENEDLRAKVSDLVVRADEADAHVKALQDKGECLTECYIQQMENLRSIQKQYFDSCREDSRLLDQDGDPLSNIGDENDTDNTEAKEYFFFSEETGKTNNAGGKKKPKKKSGKKPGGTRTTRKKPKESTDTGSDEDVADKRGRASKSDAGSGLGNQDTSGTAGNNEDPSATKHKDRNYKTRTPGDQAEAVKKTAMPNELPPPLSFEGSRLFM